MKAVLIEDNAQIIDLIEGLLAADPSIEVVGTAGKIREAVRLIEEEKPDLAFFDIELKDGLSFEIFKEIEFKDFKCIFITSFEEYALKAFQLSAIDYLTKPIDPDLFSAALEKAKQHIKWQEQEEKMEALLFNIHKGGTKQGRMVINSNDRIHSLSIRDIKRIESEGSYSEIHLKNGKLLVTSKNLNEYVKLLQDYSFLRTHQSHLINFEYFEHYDKKKGMVELTTGEEVPVSSRIRDKILKLIRELS